MIFSRLTNWLGKGGALSLSHPSLWPDVSWRIADPDDWPPVERLVEDFDWARRTGTGFVAQFDNKTWFLLHRDWFGWPDPPEWSLASYDAAGEGWRFYNDFDVLPEKWSVPEVQHAQN